MCNCDILNDNGKKINDDGDDDSSYGNASGNIKMGDKNKVKIG